ncbi:MAG: YkgJ family cysteine cluster protein [Flavobacteriales bacterium]|nr:YkgJ family cysteine cluster protein [Flavobacteriales bacterium]
MNKNLQNKLETALTNQSDNKGLVKKLKKSKPKKLDSVVHQLHEEIFEKIDCLDCANCCKTTSPAIYERDIDRLSKHLKMKPSKLIEEYLVKDSDNDYVFKTAPCPFLDYENYCTVYESRPLACREYPHTNRKRFYQVLDLSLTNTLICPAVSSIFEELKTKF